MDSKEMYALFEKHIGDYGKFERVEPKLHARPDMNAFLLIDRLVPGTNDMVACADHDEYWLGVDCEELRAVITEADIITLQRCGIRYDYQNDSLASFV